MCSFRKVRRFLLRMLSRLSLPISCLAFSFLLTSLIPLILLFDNFSREVLSGIKECARKVGMTYVNLRVWGGFETLKFLILH